MCVCVCVCVCGCFVHANMFESISKTLILCCFFPFSLPLSVSQPPSLYLYIDSHACVYVCVHKHCQSKYF